MPALKKTDIVGRVVWLGVVPDRGAALNSQAVPEIMARFAGPAGEAHGGLTRGSCSRVTEQHPRGTEIRNTRQFAVLCAEELAVIAKDMGLETLDPALLGTTMVVSGIPDFTHVPPSSRLQGQSGATLVVDMENRPCSLPARPIEGQHPDKGAAFKAAAKGRRGVTAWVEREGLFRLGDEITLHIPDQRRWCGA
ncbi:MOSC domain-containing protein [Pseudorhodobacter ferrugineus]|uniref:MOSC domain-containing protein n=1 Tax=Pseudorhodobacter ferrugineus TaxID=77008 RepID=UPI0003B564AA|nr:sulfurase [Pseudorhodobacter ferrugineus]